VRSVRLHPARSAAASAVTGLAWRPDCTAPAGPWELACCDAAGVVHILTVE
jgi:hypothetical protein